MTQRELCGSRDVEGGGVDGLQDGLGRQVCILEVPSVIRSPRESVALGIELPWSVDNLVLVVIDGFRPPSEPSAKSARRLKVL